MIEMTEKENQDLKFKIWVENKIVMITGKVDNRDESPKIICDEIEEIIEKIE